VSGVHPDLLADRPVDHDQGGNDMCRCLDGIEVEVGFAHGPHGRPQHRSVQGQAAGHHGIHREHAARQVSPARRHPRLQEIAVAAQGLDHCLYLFRGRGHHRQSVRVTVGEVPFLRVNAIQRDHVLADPVLQRS
jgi:hypothetical protein